jgi:thymidylate synthase (FAD)
METKRPTSPAAEEIVGGYFPVLDHGFVSLVDYMGTDEDVERAARVSYGYGTRKVSATRGLIRYLRRHYHTTPSEMVELKFHCAMPMFVARQWVRHRMACLAEGTEVYFDLPSGIRKKGNQLHKLPIEDIWSRFQPTVNRTRPDKQRNPHFRRDRVKGMRLRQMNEETGRVQHTRVVDVFKNGERHVYKMVLADGKEITATADHRFRFSDEWKTLQEATGLEESGGRAVWKQGDYYVHVNGLVAEAPALYQDKEWLKRQYTEKRRNISDIAEDCGVSYHTIRKWLTRQELTDAGRGCFSEGSAPCNRDLTYELGPRQLSDEWKEANRRSRSGSASNFWRGGSSADRDAIGRWTTQVAHKVHSQNEWTCQLCAERALELHCHHIVPVWADESKARELDNLTTLCAPCHREIAENELDFVERLAEAPIRTEWKPRPRVAWNKLTNTRLVRIERFEYVGLRETYDLEVEGPFHNFIANGIVTHNSINEYSGRYSLMPLLFYKPDPEHFALQSPENNQGRQSEAASAELYAKTVAHWERVRAEASEGYQWMVQEDVARELARIDLPLSTYTQWYWKIDLHNLFHFLRLRADPHAQWEIQEFARVMAGMLKRVAPLSYEAWLDYNVGGEPMSRAEMNVLCELLEGDEEGVRPKADGGANLEGLSTEKLKEAGLSGREIRELIQKLQPREIPDYELDLSQMRGAEEMAAELEEAALGSFE